MKFSDSDLLKNVLKTYYPNLEDNEAALEIAYSNVMLGFPETFSKKLKEVRVSKNLNQKEIAKMLGVTQSSYSGWETAAHTPKIENIKQLADVLSVDPSLFISVNAKDTCLDRKLPIIDPSFFSNYTSENFPEFVKNAEKNGVRSFTLVPTEFNIDFAFDLRENYMEESGNHFIPAYSLVMCNYRNLNKLSLKEKLEQLNGRVCVVGVGNSHGFVRELRFDGTILTLHAWNDKVPDRIFPVKGNIIESIASKVNLFSSSSSNNVILAKDVQIYGVATEFVKNL